MNPTDPLSEFGPYQVLSNDALQTGPSEQAWLWQGFLARRQTTLLTSQWKSGKSTLISILLSKLKTGGLLAGLPVAPGRALVVTEEDRGKWNERARRLGFSNHLSYVCRPFKGKPTHDDWLALIDQILRMHDRQPVDLVVIDTLANLSPLRSENDAGEMLKALLPLQRLTAQDLAVFASHHPRKGAIIPGQAARGSGALSGFVDIIIEMQRVSMRHPKDRRRRLDAYSRHDETPDSTIIELSQDGTDYLHLPPSAEIDFERAWLILDDIFEHAQRSLSRKELAASWPHGFAPPPRNTLYNWLKEAVNKRRLERVGDGNRRRPFKYHLPGMPMKWHEQWLTDFNKEPYETLPASPDHSSPPPTSQANDTPDPEPLQPAPPVAPQDPILNDDLQSMRRYTDYLAELSRSVQP